MSVLANPIQRNGGHAIISSHEGIDLSMPVESLKDRCTCVLLPYLHPLECRLFSVLFSKEYIHKTAGYAIETQRMFSHVCSVIKGGSRRKLIESLSHDTLEGIALTDVSVDTFIRLHKDVPPYLALIVELVLIVDDLVVLAE